MNVGVLKTPEYRQGPGNLMCWTDVQTCRIQNAVSISAVCHPINTLASETTLRRFDLLAMQLHMVPYTVYPPTVLLLTNDTNNIQ
jgi:hypothetical protein